MELKIFVALIVPALAIIARVDSRIGITVIAATMTVISLPVSADQVSAPGTVTCADPFGRESTGSDLVRAFGAANVVDQEIGVHGGGALRERGTVIYPDDPRRRLGIFWADKVNRRALVSIQISGESQWSWRKVHIGMTLEEVEVLNGKPFKLGRFTNTSGMVIDWQGGAIDIPPGWQSPGHCRFFIWFEHGAELAGGLMSSNPKVRSLRLTVSEIYIFYTYAVGSRMR